MDCNCEKAPEFPTKAFIPGPIEIPINFRAVTIPADQGDDRTNPPLNGAYRNVVLKYAANGHTYIYSSDGIPIALLVEVGDIEFNDVLDRPKYDGEPMTSSTNIPDLTDEVETLGEQIQALATDFSYKGSVEDYAHLPADAAIGDVYTTTDTGLIYVWDGTQWVALNKTVDVVQTTGASTTDVISQDGVSKLLFGKYNDNYDIEKIQIGKNASATAGNTTAIGNTAVSTYGSGIAIGYEARDAQSSVGLGAFSQPASRGEVNIGIPRATATQWDAYGHNNTPYRLLTGVSDPESAHDAATKGYVDAVAPTITMTTTDPGEGAPLSAGQFLAVYSAS